LAVVLVLAGLLLPWWSGYRKRQVAIQGVQNLRQWGIALNLYLIENESLFPAVGRMQPSGEDADAWFNALPVYLCATPLAQLAPEDRPRPGVPSLWVDALDEGEGRGDGSGAFYFGYGMNRWLHPDPERSPLHIHDVETPGETLFLAEQSGYDPGALPGQIRFRRGKKYPSPDAEALVLFCDGHVLPVKKGQLVDPYMSGAPIEHAGIWAPRAGAEEPVRP
jgi:hypothetical protein